MSEEIFELIKGAERQDNLVKALEALHVTGRDTSNLRTASGAPLKIESLEKQLKNLTYTYGHLNILWNNIPKKYTYNTVSEWNEQSSYGSVGNAFTLEAGLPETVDSIFTRRSQNVKYMGVVKSITHPMKLMRTNIKDLMKKLQQDGILWLLRELNYALYFADARQDAREFNGILTQHHDRLGDDNTIDCKGNPLTEQDLEDASNMIIENYGIPNHFYAGNTVISDFVKNFYGYRYVIPNTSSTMDATMGQHVVSYASQAANISMFCDVFFKSKLDNYPPAPVVFVPKHKESEGWKLWRSNNDESVNHIGRTKFYLIDEDDWSRTHSDDVGELRKEKKSTGWILWKTADGVDRNLNGLTKFYRVTGGQWNTRSIEFNDYGISQVPPFVSSFKLPIRKEVIQSPTNRPYITISNTGNIKLTEDIRPCKVSILDYDGKGLLSMFQNSRNKIIKKSFYAFTAFNEYGLSKNIVVQDELSKKNTNSVSWKIESRATGVFIWKTLNETPVVEKDTKFFLAGKILLRNDTCIFEHRGESLCDASLLEGEFYIRLNDTTFIQTKDATSPVGKKGKYLISSFDDNGDWEPNPFDGIAKRNEFDYERSIGYHIWEGEDRKYLLYEGFWEDMDNFTEEVKWSGERNSAQQYKRYITYNNKFGLPWTDHKPNDMKVSPTPYLVLADELLDYQTTDAPAYTTYALTSTDGDTIYKPTFFHFPNAALHYVEIRFKRMDMMNKTKSTGWKIWRTDNGTNIDENTPLYLVAEGTWITDDMVFYDYGKFIGKSKPVVVESILKKILTNRPPQIKVIPKEEKSVDLQVNASYDDPGILITKNYIDAFMAQMNTDVVEFLQLAPLMRMDIGKLAPADRFMLLLYGTPMVYDPMKIVKFINVGKTHE